MNAMTAQWVQCPVCSALVPDVSLTKHTAWHQEFADQLAAAHDLPGMYIRRQRVTVPALILGGKATLNITWAEALPTADYKVALALDPALLGKVTATAGTKTKAGMQVSVAAGIAVASGVLDATAYTLIHESEA